MRGFLTIWVIASCFFLPKAWCRYYDLYRADYVKGAFCSVIGGACAADTDFDNSFFQNPASLTAGGSNWDYDYDMLQGSNLEPGMKAGNDVSDSTFMFGAAYSGKKLGVGLSFLKHNTSVGALGTFSDDAAGGSAQFRTNTEADLYQFNVPISIKLSPKYDFGVTLTAIYQKIDIKVSGQNGTAANTAQQPGPTLGIATGGIYRINSSFITGGWLRLPMTYYTKQNITTQSTFTKFNYTEDLALHYPWLWAIGIGWTPWKNKNGIFLDLNYVGATENGYLLTYDNFAAAEADKRLVRKGSNSTIDPRLGIRLPFFKFDQETVSLGSYYESSRWDGFSGLMHYTAGFAIRFPNFQFLMFDGPELMIGGDFAKDYSTIFFTYR